MMNVNERDETKEDLKMKKVKITAENWVHDYVEINEISDTKFQIWDLNVELIEIKDLPEEFDKQFDIYVDGERIGAVIEDSDQKGWTAISGDLFRTSDNKSHAAAKVIANLF